MSEHPWGHRTADDAERRAFTPLNSVPKPIDCPTSPAILGPEAVSMPEVLRDILIVDAFTNRPYAGNAAAVVPDAAGLSGSQMQIIARDMNLSETVFITASTQATA